MNSNRITGYLATGLVMMGLLEPSMHLNIPATVNNDARSEVSTTWTNPDPSHTDNIEEDFVSLASWSKITSIFYPGAPTDIPASLSSLAASVNFMDPSLFINAGSHIASLSTKTVAALSTNIPLGISLAAESDAKIAADALLKTEAESIALPVTDHALLSYSEFCPHGDLPPADSLPVEDFTGDVFFLPN